MQKKKENFFKKIVKKDYNNELEEILEKKDFEENTKNLLLEILYKIEVAYKDYKTVKRDIEKQDEYIKNMINVIQKDCKIIKTVKPNSEEAKILNGKQYQIDRQEKSIICFPIERNILYSISQISKQEKIINEKYYLIDTTLSDLINIGNNIDKVEPLRNFNGWSWSIIKKEIENIPYNLVYQNLRILLSSEFLENWIKNKEYILDYYEILQIKLEEKYGKENKEKFIELLNLISVLIYKELNPNEKERLNQEEEQKEELLKKFEQKEEYIEEITKEKQEISNKIKNLEKIKASKKELQEEYKKRNEKLPLEKKIFSMKVLAKQLEQEKQELKEDLEKRNKMLNPSKYVEEKTKVENQYKLLQNADLSEKIIELQKVFLDCIDIIIKNANEKDEMINIIYNLRYYEMLPINDKQNVQEIEALKKKLTELEDKIWKKAQKYKVINENANQTIFKYIFQTKIISLQDIYVTIKMGTNKIRIELSEDNENGFEEKFEIGKEEIDENNIFRSNRNGYRFKLFS